MWDRSCSSSSGRVWRGRRGGGSPPPEGKRFFWGVGGRGGGGGGGGGGAAGLGEHVGDGAGQGEEVVRLVDVDGRVAALLFRNAGAGGGGLPGRGEHERAHQPGGLLAELPFRQSGEQDPAVEDTFHGEAGTGCYD